MKLLLDQLIRSLCRYRTKRLRSDFGIMHRTEFVTLCHYKEL